jgi:hypothetical protein
MLNYDLNYEEKTGLGLSFFLQSYNPSHRPKSPILISILFPLGTSNRVSAAARREQSHRRTGCPRENGKQELSQINQLIQYNPALPPSSHYFATLSVGALRCDFPAHGLERTDAAEYRVLGGVCGYLGELSPFWSCLTGLSPSSILSKIRAATTHDEMFLNLGTWTDVAERPIAHLHLAGPADAACLISVEAARACTVQAG